MKSYIIVYYDCLNYKICNNKQKPNRNYLVLNVCAPRRGDTSKENTKNEKEKEVITYCNKVFVSKTVISVRKEIFVKDEIS